MESGLKLGKWLMRLDQIVNNYTMEENMTTCSR
jgi:hypothetical protein